MPAALQSGPDIGLPGISLTLSVTVIVTILITVVQVLWTTLLLIELAAGRSPDLRAAFGGTFAKLGRGVVALLVGIGGTLAILALMLALLGPHTWQVGIVLAAVLTVVWNFLAAALLIAVLCDEGSVGQALGRGLRAGPGVALALKGPMLTVLLVLGVLSFAWSSTGSTFNTSTNWQMNSKVLWLPTLPDRSGWYSTWCGLWDVPANDFVVFVLSLPLTVMTLAFALRVAGEFDGARETDPTDRVT